MIPRPASSRDGYARIQLYAPDRSSARIDLSDNTNPWGMPPAAKEAIAAIDASRMTRYPSLYAERLKAALAEYCGVPSDMIVTGCGSDDVLDSAIRAFAEPGDAIACAEPTFPMIPIFGRMNGLDPIAVPLTPAYEVDGAALIATDARIIYLCSPNNPTGTSTPVASIERLLSTIDAARIVIVDEAYFEYSGVTAIELTRRFDRLLITRTMSKGFGLAGLRIGYAIGAPALIAEVEKSRGPYKVSAIAEAAAVAALGDGLSWVREHAALSNANRNRLVAELRKRRLALPDSAANFVFVPIAGASVIATAMRREGVAVRAFTDLPRISPTLDASGGSALRISVGTWEQIEETLRTFDEAGRRCA